MISKISKRHFCPLLAPHKNALLDARTLKLMGFTFCSFTRLYHQVPADVWFEWTPEMRKDYVLGIQKLSMINDVFKQKDVPWPSFESSRADETTEFRSLDTDIVEETGQWSRLFRRKCWGLEKGSPVSPKPPYSHSAEGKFANRRCYPIWSCKQVSGFCFQRSCDLCVWKVQARHIDQRKEKKHLLQAQSPTRKRSKQTQTLYTEIYHNENPFILMFLTDGEKDARIMPFGLLSPKEGHPLWHYIFTQGTVDVSRQWWLVQL